MGTMETAEAHTAVHAAAHTAAHTSAVPDALPLTLDYPVFCAVGTRQHLAAIVQQVAPAHRIAVISDDTVAAVHAPQVMAQFEGSTASLFTIPPGEQEKTRERWASLTDALMAWGAGRDTTIVALGGGVICDLSGFVAATYMRGLPVVQVPTTLLAMVDASVGGKTAVDTPAGKNLVGAFHNPAAVVIDPEVLTSLPPAILRSGLAEMIKHGVIADVAYFDRLLQALPSLLARGAQAPEFGALIAGSVRIKAAVVAEDSREGGLRQILNFGHTIAHAVEKLLHYDMLHGDAVAMGMVAEARLAERLGMAGPGLAAAVEDAVRRAGLPTRLPVGVSAASVVAETLGDKKARAGAARYALPRALGEMDPADGRWSVPVADPIVMEVLAGLL
ncbi:3-dehydroquinate synthase [Gemmatimonas aurantiaca]|uniref:3-dehydroquinate synthase n=1 Tax=Gemmatimonas aurantiaca TaxID=173480 RepID=UPI00301D5518